MLLPAHLFSSNYDYWSTKAGTHLSGLLPAYQRAYCPVASIPQVPPSCIRLFACTCNVVACNLNVFSRLRNGMPAQARGLYGRLTAEQRTQIVRYGIKCNCHVGYSSPARTRGSTPLPCSTRGSPSLPRSGKSDTSDAIIAQVSRSHVVISTSSSAI